MLFGWLVCGGLASAYTIAAHGFGAAAVVVVAHRLWLWRRTSAGTGEPIVDGPRLPLWRIAVLLAGWQVFAVASLWQEDRLVLNPRPMMALGSPVIFGVGWAALTLIGSIASFAATRDRKLRGGYLLAGVLAVTLVLTRFDLADTHRVWTLQAGATSALPAASSRPTFERHLARWLLDRQGQGPGGGSAGSPIPLLVVAAHGGGLRAAYWTAMSLAYLEKAQPGFHCRVFAVVGVSGGSLGALFWQATLPPRPDGVGRCGEGPPVDQRDLLDRVLGHDFLAADLFALLAVDLPARFVPDWRNLLTGSESAFSLTDRQRFLEAAWIAAAPDLLAASRNGEGNPDRRAREFLELVRPESADTDRPALFLVATEVRTGDRAIVSDVAFGGDVVEGAMDILAVGRCPDLGGGLSVTGCDLALPAVTAAGLSARFPWISPMGRLPGGAGVLDGGLFERTGAETAADLLRAFARRCAPKRDDLGTYVCAIDATGPVAPSFADPNSPADMPFVRIDVRPMALQLVNAPVEGRPASGPSRFAPETLGPIVALNVTRSARGRAAWRSLDGDVQLFDRDTHATAKMEMDAERADASIPLSWTLSKLTRSRMKERLRELLDLRAPDNRRRDEEVACLLKLGFGPRDEHAAACRRS
jgi:hypothetical protein